MPADEFNSKNMHGWNPRGELISVVITSISFKDGDMIWYYFNQLYHWMMESTGPDILWWNETPGPNSGGQEVHKMHYDPTNGTVSAGQIRYFDTWGFGPGPGYN